MIKIFGKVRQKLLSENRFSKYLLYAIGEIILVVVGILIALQINNWNEADKERAIGNGYLNRIHSDLTKDTVYLQEKLAFAKSEQQSFIKYLRSIYEQQSDVEEFVELTSSVGWDAANLVLEDKTYVEITSSGKFSFIENDKIRDQIMDYYRKYAAADSHISEMNQTGIAMFSAIYKKFIKYFDILQFLFDEEHLEQSNDWKFVNNPDSAEFKDLESVATFYYYKQTVFENYYRELNLEASKLIAAIEKEVVIPSD